MTINPIGITNPNQALDPTSFQTRMQQALAPVAQLFGESSDQLMAQLNSGHTSLSALAANNGITQAQLTDAIKQGVQQSSPNGQSMSDTQLTNIANRIANHRHGGGHHHHGGGGAAPASSATSLDSSTQALLALLESQDPNQTQNLG